MEIFHLEIWYSVTAGFNYLISSKGKSFMKFSIHVPLSPSSVHIMFSD